MTDLISWLRHQLDTDEAEALAALPIRSTTSIPDEDYPRAFTAFDRVLRQVQAHRAILDHVAGRLSASESDGGRESADAETDGMASSTLRALASIYSDKDGWKEEWSA